MAAGITMVRQYKINSWQCVKERVGNNEGFSRYICFSPANNYIESTPPNQNSYIEREVGMSTSFAVEKDGIWCVWRPGWGVDIHFPHENAPEYMKRWDANQYCDYVDGPCHSDGSSLADGEQFWPAFKASGTNGVFLLLEEWWRPVEEED